MSAPRVRLHIERLALRGVPPSALDGLREELASALATALAGGPPLGEGAAGRLDHLRVTLPANPAGANARSLSTHLAEAVRGALHGNATGPAPSAPPAGVPTRGPKPAAGNGGRS